MGKNCKMVDEDMLRFGISESDLEAAVLEWLESLGWSVACGRKIAPDTSGEERTDYGAVTLEQRLRDALAGINPDLPALDNGGQPTTEERKPGNDRRCGKA